MEIANEKKALRGLRILLIGTGAATAAGIALRIISLLLFYDRNIGYYSAGAVLPTVMNILLVCAVVLILAGVLLLAKNSDIPKGDDKGIAVKISSTLCALAFAALALMTLYSFVSLFYAPSWKSLLFLAASLLSAAYFVMNFLKKGSDVQSLLSIAVIIFAVYVLAISYFDVYTQMNSPNKLILHMACLSSMIFFLSEARCLIGTQKKKTYIFSLCVSVLLLGTSSVPSIIAFHLGILENYEYVLFDYAFLFLWIYILVRFVFCFIKPKNESASEISDTPNTELDSAEAADYESPEDTVSENIASDGSVPSGTDNSDDVTKGNDRINNE
ncbi:MAG: hypothetical protein IJ038_04935 [Clostridia bacterium]|nr:hypothetical protein [Clostridia bacterium]